MNKNKMHYGIVAFAALAMSACNGVDKGAENPSSETRSSQFERSVVPDNFNYSTKKQVSVEVVVYDLNGQLLPYASVNVFTMNADKESLLVSGQADETGRYNEVLMLSSAIEEVKLSVSSFGIKNIVNVPVIDGKVEYIFKS